MQAFDIKLVNSLKDNIEESVVNDDMGGYINYLAELATDEDILKGNYVTEGDNKDEFE